MSFRTSKLSSRTWLTASTALVALALAAPAARAQVGNSQAAGQASGPPDTAAAGASASPPSPYQANTPPLTPSNQLQEVVVTAERREATVQRTAADVEVVGAKTLERQHITDLSDLNSVLTDTQIVPIVAATQVTIRGIGSNFLDPRADPGVATSINGLFFDRALPLGFGFLDVARVEDLEGPQGTLYGRNAAAGALNIITNQPSKVFGGNIQVSGGDYGENEETGVVNVPVGDTFAFRVAYDRDRRDGYIDNYYDDINTDTGRISARWTPTDKLTLYAEADYNHVGGHGGFSESYPCSGAQPFSIDVPRACPPASLIAAGPAPETGREGSYVEAYQGRADYNFGFATLTSISGFVGTHERLYDSPDGSYFNQTVTGDNFDYSEEIRLAGNSSASHSGGLAWQLGTYLFDSTGDYFSHTQANTSVSPIAGILDGTTTYSKIPQSSEAGYAQATYGITDRLRLTGGLRYTHDFKGLSSSAFSYVPLAFTEPGPVSNGRASASDNKWTYKVGMEYDLAPRHLIYGNISSGYVAGGANGGSASAPLPPSVTPATFSPETITAYEIGSKNRLLDGRLQVNGDFYYYDFKNYQYLYTSLVQGGGSFYNFEVQNVAPLTSYGLEASVVYALTSHDQLSASFAYTHARFGQINLDDFPPPAGPAITITVPSGSRLPNAPDESALLGYVHTWELGQQRSLDFTVNTKISSNYLLVIGSSDPDDVQPSYTMTDVSMAFHWDGDKYTIRGYAKNLEDSAVNVYGQGLTYHLYGIEPPRTYGFTVSANF